MNLNRFSKRDLCETLDVVNDTVCCKTEEDFKQLMERAKELINANNCICGLGRYDDQGLSEVKAIMNVSYPKEWLSVYEEKKLYLVDPIVNHQFKFSGTQLWADTYKKYKDTVPPDFIYNADSFGLKYGITSGLKSISKNLASIITFSNHSDYFKDHQKMIMDILTPHLHEALNRVLKEAEKKEFPYLTSREKEILSWIKEGKTNWEISAILNISERTVKFHVQNILSKLDAVSKTQAVAIMMEHENYC